MNNKTHNNYNTKALKYKCSHSVGVHALSSTLDKTARLSTPASLRPASTAARADLTARNSRATVDLVGPVLCARHETSALPTHAKTTARAQCLVTETSSASVPEGSREPLAAPLNPVPLIHVRMVPPARTTLLAHIDAAVGLGTLVTHANF